MLFFLTDAHLLMNNDAFKHARLITVVLSYQKKAKMEGTLIGFSSDVNHLSPGSVLDASFSNDSCISSSLDDGTGNAPEFMLLTNHPTGIFIYSSLNIGFPWLNKLDCVFRIEVAS